jgi:hypothetical protein
MAGGLCHNYALKKHAFRLLSVAGLGSGGCMRICKGCSREETKCYGGALVGVVVGIVMVLTGRRRCPGEKAVESREVACY